MSITRQDSIVYLRSITSPATGDMVELTGYYAPGDGGGGEFYWDPLSSLTDNNGTVIKPNSVLPTNPGRWLRVFQEPVNVQWFGAKGDGSTDDTSSISGAITAAGSGELVFVPGLTYIISSSLTLANPLTVDLSGSTIQFAASVYGTTIPAFSIQANGVTIKNGRILGNYVPTTTTPPTPGVGNYGIDNTSANKNSNLTVDGLTIEKVENYGIASVSGVGLRVINSTFLNTGYFSIWSDNKTTVVDGGLIDNNIFDRSAITASKIKYSCVGIRGDSTSTQFYTLGWVITNNRFTTALTPTDPSAACIEVRSMQNSTVSNNVFNNGTIGLSIVGCTNVTAVGNATYGSVIGIELASSNYCTVDGNTVNGNGVSGTTGIMVDGAVTAISSYNTISNNIVSGNTVCGIEIYRASANNSIIGGVVIQATTGTMAINLLGAPSTRVSGVRMYGQSIASSGIVLDNSNITSNSAFNINGSIIDGCHFDNFTGQGINVFGNSANAITGLRVMNNFATGTMLSPNLLSGATISAPYYYGNSPEISGSKIVLAAGTNSGAGVAAAMTAGSVTVSNTGVTANSIILLSVLTPGGTQGTLSYSVTAGASFTIHSSSSSDTSTVAWVIVN